MPLSQVVVYPWAATNHYSPMEILEESACLSGSPYSNRATEAKLRMPPYLAGITAFRLCPDLRNLSLLPWSQGRLLRLPLIAAPVF